uniref:Uncharacterized protein n=1 Tax=Romanomermis culicivorax TaxID=13658 RepID=A0A915ILD0_ROMCU
MPRQKVRKSHSIEDEILDILVKSCSISETGFVHENQIVKNLLAERPDIGKDKALELIYEALDQWSSEGLCLEGSSRWWRPVKAGSEEQKGLKLSFSRKPKRCGGASVASVEKRRCRSPSRDENHEENEAQKVQETRQSPASATVGNLRQQPRKFDEKPETSVVRSESESKDFQSGNASSIQEEFTTTTKKMGDPAIEIKMKQASIDKSCKVDSVFRYSMGAQMLVHLRRKKPSNDLDDDKYRLEYEGIANLQRKLLEVD